jgi:hypothetical protein
MVLPVSPAGAERVVTEKQLCMSAAAFFTHGFAFLAPAFIEQTVIA